MAIYGNLLLMNITHFEIIEGKKPVLLSAPHAYIHKRPNLSMVYRQGERYTDNIVRNICELTGTWGIILTEDVEYDPNFYKEKNNPYKQAIRKIVRENKIEQFIDIHGLSLDKYYDIAIYYPNRFTKSKDFADLVKDGMGKGSLYGTSVSLLKFYNDSQEALCEFLAQRMRVPAIQMEIARYIREDKKLRNSFIENLSVLLNKRFV